MSEEEKAALAMDWLKEAQKVSRETGKDYWLCLVTIVERESFEAAAKECESMTREENFSHPRRFEGLKDAAARIRALAKGR